MNIRDDETLRQLLSELANHPITYGFGAAIARWMLGDREGGWKTLLSYAACACFVALAGSLYLADEGLTGTRRGFYIIALSFVAKDLLFVVVQVAAQFRKDPFGTFRRVKDALSGHSPKPPENET